MSDGSGPGSAKVEPRAPDGARPGLGLVVGVLGAVFTVVFLLSWESVPAPRCEIYDNADPGWVVVREIRADWTLVLATGERFEAPVGQRGGPPIDLWFALSKLIDQGPDRGPVRALASPSGDAWSLRLWRAKPVQHSWNVLAGARPLYEEAWCGSAERVSTGEPDREE